MDRQIIHTWFYFILGPVYKKSKHMSPETLKEKKKLNCAHTNLFWDLTTTCREKGATQH